MTARPRAVVRKDEADDLWAFTGELFHTDERRRIDRRSGRSREPAPADQYQTEVLQTATLACPKKDWMQKGGRSGHHSEHLGYLSQRAAVAAAACPGVTWQAADTSVDSALRARGLAVSPKYDPEIPS